jgi:hypothetical protein
MFHVQLSKIRPIRSHPAHMVDSQQRRMYIGDIDFNQQTWQLRTVVSVSTFETEDRGSNPHQGVKN